MLCSFCYVACSWCMLSHAAILGSLWLQVYEERQAQVTMDSFLAFSQRFAKVKSKRHWLAPVPASAAQHC